MERRKFLQKSAIGSSCILAGAMLPHVAEANKPEQDSNIKITILKRSLNKEWNTEFRKSEGKKCPVFQDGQEFVLESPWSAPDGFCQWAWADIRTFIHLVREGKYETFVSCCTDGFRPVFFKIERV